MPPTTSKKSITISGGKGKGKGGSAKLGDAEIVAQLEQLIVPFRNGTIHTLD